MIQGSNPVRFTAAVAVSVLPVFSLVSPTLISKIYTSDLRSVGKETMSSERKLMKKVTWKRGDVSDVTL